MAAQRATIGCEMSDPIRIIKHEAVPNCGSYEVRFADGRASVFFYWDDVPGRQLQPDRLTGAEALEQARALAREKGMVSRHHETHH